MEQDIRIVSYDMLLMCTYQCITDHIEVVLQSLSELGFEVNSEHTSYMVTPVSSTLDFLCDSEVPWITVPTACGQKLRKDIRHASKKGNIKARFLACIAWQCVSMCKM